MVGMVLFGLALVFNQSPWNIIPLTIGSTFLTLGITLPIAIYYQAESNNESFQLLKACNQSGIRAIFISRQQDNDNLRDAIDKAAESTSSELFFLGICFHSLFDPNVPHTREMDDKLHDPYVKMRIMILDPESDAATRRAQIEKGNTTVDDIKTTLEIGLVSTVQIRMAELMNDDNFRKLKHAYVNASNDREKQETLKEIIKKVNVEVQIYAGDPIMFIMGFDDSMFVEQYHFGRVDNIIRFGGCIGKHMPVVQYLSTSRGYQFSKQHFEYMWAKYEQSNDRTTSIVEKAMDI
jgi:hypothetical protein